MKNTKWSSLLHKIPASENRKDTYFYRSGDNAILVEYGFDVDRIDYMDMFRVNAVNQAAIMWQASGYKAMEGYICALPQWRTIQYYFDPLIMSMEKMLDIAVHLEEFVGDNSVIATMQFNSPVIEVPYAWQHRSCAESIKKYLEEINPDAYWCDKERLSNVPYICATNGVTEEELKKLFFGTEYFCYTSCFLPGLCMTVPVDRRHMILCEKYNPPRTWSARNTRGVGGFDEGGYPVAAAGGYQLLGVCAPLMQMDGKHPDFAMDMTMTHQLDRLRFVEVSEEEIDRIIDLVDSGSPEFRFKITPGSFSVADWVKSEEEHRDEIEAHLRKISRATEKYYADLKKQEA